MLTCMDARRIALIKPSALGDIVHALPVLSALRRGSRPPTSPGSSTRPTNRCSRHPDLTERLPSTAARSKAYAAVARLVLSFGANCAGGASTSSSTCKGCSAPG